MPRNQYNTPFTLTLKSSLQKKLLILFPHLVAMVIVLFTLSIPFYWIIILILLLLFSAIYNYRLHIDNSLNKSVLKISQDSAKNWVIFIQNGTSIPVTLLNSTYASKYLIINNYIDINKNKYSTVFTPDSLSSHDFRHLFVLSKLT
ncbi:MAG: protein YgfX [Cocleimonas sp.]